MAGVDLLLADAWVFHHLFVVLGDGDVTEGLAIDALDVIRREEVHIIIALSQLKGDIRHDDAQREGLNADLLIRILALGIQEVHDVRVVRVEVDRAGTLAGTELIGVGEGILQQLHHGDDAGRLVLNVLNWCTGLADIRQQEGHAAAALGKLQRGVDGAADGLHVVLDAQQEAGDELAALGLAGVEEGRGSRLEAAGHDLVYEVLGQACVAVRQEQGRHGHAVLKALEVAAAIKGLQRIAGVVLIRAQEGLEAELIGISALEQLLNKGEIILLNDLRVVVLVINQVIDLFFQIMEVDRVLINVLQEELVSGLAVFFKLNLAVSIVEIQHRVQSVVIQLLFWLYWLGDGLPQLRTHS